MTAPRDDDAPLSALRNMGPAMERAFAAVGITTVGGLRALGTDAAYDRLLAAGTRPHFIMYYVVDMALQDRPWTDCTGAEKAALRLRFDRLKARHATPDLDAFDAMMNVIGLPDR